mgnify:CR=1 FL=1
MWPQNKWNTTYRNIQRIFFFCYKFEIWIFIIVFFLSIEINYSCWLCDKRTEWTHTHAHTRICRMIEEYLMRMYLCHVYVCVYADNHHLWIDDEAIHSNIEWQSLFFFLTQSISIYLYVCLFFQFLNIIQVCLFSTFLLVFSKFSFSHVLLYYVQ